MRSIGKSSISNRRGVLGVEMVVSIVLMTMLAGVAAKAIFDYYRTQDNYTWRQTAIWAAEGQLQRYRAGAEIDSSPPEGIVPDCVSLKTTVEKGQGQWEGFNRVMVTATVAAPGGRSLHEEVSGYVPMEVSP